MRFIAILTVVAVATLSVACDKRIREPKSVPGAPQAEARSEPGV